MLARLSYLLFSLASSGVRAQDATSMSGLEIRLTSPERKESRDFECGDNFDWRVESPRIIIMPNYTEACYNINEIFAWEHANLSNPRSTCFWRNSDCPNEWELQGKLEFNPNATNSIVSIRSAANTAANASVNVLQIFEGQDCDENRDWHQWSGCETLDYECTELPYSAESFRVSYQGEGNRTEECMIAAEQGDSSMLSIANVVPLFSIAVGISVAAAL